MKDDVYPFAECKCEHFYEDHRDHGGRCEEDLEDHNGRCPCPSFVHRESVKQ